MGTTGQRPITQSAAADPGRRARFRTNCPVCSGAPLVYAFSLDSYRLMTCKNCSAMLINPQPTDEELAAIYSREYFLLQESARGREHFAEIKRLTGAHYLDMIEQYRGGRGGRLLEIGCGEGDGLVEAQARGYRVCGLDVSESSCASAQAKLGSDARILQGMLEDLPEGELFDIVIMADVLEHVREPLATLRRVHRMLNAGGTLFLALPSLDSWSARMLGTRWMEFKAEHLTYFDSNNLQTLLLRGGFSDLIVDKNTKYLSAEYIRAHFERYPISRVSGLVQLGAAILPEALRWRPTPVVASGVVALATKAEDQPRRKLSIVVPAYNEAATLATLLNSLVQKELEGVDREIVVVESNSEDGTREIAQRFADAGLIRLILEERPRGKGHAVRVGLAHATGDIILIQDADLEYDTEDYDSLLQPILTGRVAFVLGARHGGGKWKLRQFEGQSVLASFLNFGHRLFTFLVNVMFGLKLRDPMTMYKVFRRDCLTGLKFESNRFDFDYELLVRLVQKGYRPIEIPVNYRSRSFASGKKVNIWRDPWTWLWVLLKLRFSRCNVLAEVGAQRRRQQGE